MEPNNTENKKQIVISGVNLFAGGTLTILQECLLFLENSKEITSSYSIVALVYKKELFPLFKNIELISYSKPRGNWLYKLYYEYIYFNKLSKQRRVYLWFSLYDMSPSVRAERRAVYCHNPSPFYKTSAKERRFDKGFLLFTLFYKYLYAINIKKNTYVVVQQDWIRKKFIEMFHLPTNCVIVAHPNLSVLQTKLYTTSPNKKVCFLYPALPRVFKNFEIIINAVFLLRKQTQLPFEVLLTINGTENKYAEYIKVQADNVPEIKLIGLKNKEEIHRLYQSVSCLLFPSKLETWGLPITEAKLYHLPMLVADLPYAKETVGNYGSVSFFEPSDTVRLANLMINILNNNIIFDGNQIVTPSEPFSESWSKTFDFLLQ